ncbi:MAG: ATP-binding protein, partial [Cyclobacteriaceae bacterium]
MLLNRLKEREIRKYLKHFPAVGITGPRQCGKSTLAKEIIRSYKKAMYLDLENPEDRAKLTDPSLFLSQNQGKLICFDEVQFMPELFMILRSVIDRNKKNGQFLLLGSASPELLKQSSETLAGRIVYTELSPFGLIETHELPKTSLQKLWVRGGFPMSFLAKQENISFVWRKNFVRTFLERDLSAFGVGIAPENMRRFWMMCAHLHGQALNLSSLGNSLGITHTTVKHYVDVMVNTYMLRKIEPYYANIDKRLKKSSKIYLADSGLLHTLLNISSINDLMSHPVAGFSWEGFVLSQLMSHLPD